MPSEASSHGFIEGDRVDHPKFGHGTVQAVQQKVIEVLFDDFSDAPKRFMASFATKISSPESRPFMFWDREWQSLRAAWLKARRATEAASSTFRPAPDSAELRNAAAQEEDAWRALEAFLTDEREGRHS